MKFNNSSYYTLTDFVLKQKMYKMQEKTKHTWWSATTGIQRKPYFAYETSWRQKTSNIGLMKKRCVSSNSFCFSVNKVIFSIFFTQSSHIRARIDGTLESGFLHVKPYDSWNRKHSFLHRVSCYVSVLIFKLLDKTWTNFNNFWYGESIRHLTTADYKFVYLNCKM